MLANDTVKNEFNIFVRLFVRFTDSLKPDRSFLGQEVVSRECFSASDKRLSRENSCARSFLFLCFTPKKSGNAHAAYTLGILVIPDLFCYGKNNLFYFILGFGFGIINRLLAYSGTSFICMTTKVNQTEEWLAKFHSSYPFFQDGFYWSFHFHFH